MKRHLRTIAGFTLMEINLVLFLFGAGITVVLSVYPVGLRQAQQAFSDTAEVAFAECVLSQIQSAARTIPEADWRRPSRFRDIVMKDVKVDEGQKAISLTSGKKGELISDYLADRAYMRYCLEIVDLGNPSAGKGGLDEHALAGDALPYRWPDEKRKDAGGHAIDWPPPRYRAVLWATAQKTGAPKAAKPFFADLYYFEEVAE